MNVSPEIHIYPDLAALAEEAAKLLGQRASQAIHTRGRCAVLLSGGSTPRAVYERLGQAAQDFELDWTKVHLFWGDERCVPPDHADSNYNLVRRTLLSKIPIPEPNVFRIHGEMIPEEAAIGYEIEVRAFFSHWWGNIDETGRFDLALLGLGEDGHVASLFPDSTALQEEQRWFVAVQHDMPPPPLVPRVTATLPLINAAKKILFLVVGESKAERVCQALTRESERVLPVQLVQPVDGSVLWLLDRQAALKLPAAPT